jgi:hypothetical protein
MLEPFVERVVTQPSVLPRRRIQLVIRLLGGSALPATVGAALGSDNHLWGLVLLQIVAALLLLWALGLALGGRAKTTAN